MIRSILSVSLLVSVSGALAQEVCRPDYQFTRQSCKSTGKVLSVETVRYPDYLAHQGACKVPDINALGSDGKPRVRQDILKAYPLLKEEDVQVDMSNCRLEKIGAFCSDRQKVDVRCDFVAKVPVMETASDESCPIVDVRDAAGCMAKESANIDPQSQDSCLKLNPANEKDWWTKVACLSDLNQAAQSFNGKGVTKSEEVSRQVNLATKKTSERQMDQLFNYLIQRQKSAQ